MAQYIVGALLFALGVALVVKTDFFYGLTGALDWPEKVIGPGGTRLFLKLFGLASIFVAFLLWSGTLGDIGRAVLTPTIPNK